MISLNTIALKDALSRVNKCANRDKSEPLTQLLHIKTRDAHTIDFTSTDVRNTLTYTLVDDTADFEMLDFCVLIDQFVKLVSKFNSVKTDMYISETGNEVKIRADGNYTISIPIDSDGNPIQYPDVVPGEPVSEVYSGPISSILSAIGYCEGSITKLTPDIQVEDYPRTNYYVGDKVISLDGFLATVVSGDFLPFNILVSPVTLKLLSNFTDEGFKMYKDSKYVVFQNNNCKLLTVEPEGIDAFPNEVAVNMMQTITGNPVNIAAAVTVQSLNRLNLFTDETYENNIKLKFNGKGVFAYTINEACCEQLSADPQETEYECYIDINSLIAQLKVYGTDVVTLYYGDVESKCIKLEFGNVEQLIVLSDLSVD
nr:MAG TPA: DNA polymerase III, beta subunit, DNA Polymerase III, beta.0A [Caudoviricetes sp.]